MHPRLLEHYNAELLYMHELAQEFANAHPKIAKRLGMQAGEVGDPFVERLLQSSAFSTARMQMRLDETFAEFTQPLLQTLYPNYVSQTPSMAVARVFPLVRGKQLANATVVPRGTAFMSRVPDGELTACEFRSSQDVTLYPLEIAQARLTGIPPDIPGLGRYVAQDVQIQGALRLLLRTINGAPISSLAELDRLTVCLAGDEASASHLFELVHAAGVATITGVPGEFTTGTLHVVTENAVVHDALEPEQSLLPAVPHKFHGHNLLQEYFSCPARFWFFTLTGLCKGLSAIGSNEAEIVVLLDRRVDKLAETVDASHFALFCTPIINLFPRRTEWLTLGARATDHPLVPVAKFPRDYEVYSVSGAWGQVSEHAEALRFHPLHARYRHGDGQSGRYFTIRRELARPADDSRHYGSRRPFTETRTFLSLLDQNGMPDAEGIRNMSLEALLTNRDLPCVVPRNGVSDLSVASSIPQKSIGLLRAPTTPRPPLAFGKRAWQLIGQLSFTYRAFDGRPDQPCAGDALRRLMDLYLGTESHELRRQVAGLVGATATPVNRRLALDGDHMFGRGIECELIFDETEFGGVSPYTLALVLERYVARHVSPRSFTTTVLRSKQRGRIGRWPPRAGTRDAV
jgi:type VI secretion system protein ImpG